MFTKIGIDFVDNLKTKHFISEFLYFLTKLNFLPDIIILRETWFLNDNFDIMDGYYGYLSGRENRRRGGISIFVKKNVNFKVVPSFSNSLPEIEFIHINIFLRRD